MFHQPIPTVLNLLRQIDLREVGFRPWQYSCQWNLHRSTWCSLVQSVSWQCAELSCRQQVRTRSLNTIVKRQVQGSEETKSHHEKTCNSIGHHMKQVSRSEEPVVQNRIALFCSCSVFVRVAQCAKSNRQLLLVVRRVTGLTLFRGHQPPKNTAWKAWWQFFEFNTSTSHVSQYPCRRCVRTTCPNTVRIRLGDGSVENGKIENVVLKKSWLVPHPSTRTG